MDRERLGIENHRLSIEILLETIDLEWRARSGEAGDRNPLETLGKSLRFLRDFDPRPLPTPAGWPWPALREAGDRPSSRNPDSVEIL